MYWLNFNEMIIDIPPEPCPAGQYRSADMAECAKCGGNEISTEGASSCTACGSGTVANGDNTKCGMFDEMIVHLTIDLDHDMAPTVE